jgi:large subunit ribosomal protein L19e
MKLDKKKALAAKVFGVGKDRIIFVPTALNEIKEAITRQDIVDLHNSGAIQVREIKGRKTVEKRKHRRGIGKVEQKVNQSKREYVRLSRKLRATTKGLLRMKKITKDDYYDFRRMIKASRFKSRRHLLEHTKEIKEQ